MHILGMGDEGKSPMGTGQPDKRPDKFARNLRQLREARGLSRQRLAKLLGCDQSYIVKLESGERRLKADWMARLEHALNVEPGTLMNNVDSGAAPIQNVPVLGWSSAGRPMEAVSQPASEYVPVPSTSTTLAAVRVRGQSMDRVAPNNSLIVYDYQMTDLFDRGLYLIELGGEVTFKRYRSSDGPSRFEPDSTESGHSTIYPAPGVEVRIVGRVVYAVRALA